MIVVVVVLVMRGVVVELWRQSCGGEDTAGGGVELCDCVCGGVRVVRRPGVHCSGMALTVVNAVLRGAAWERARGEGTGGRHGGTVLISHAHSTTQHTHAGCAHEWRCMYGCMHAAARSMSL